MLLPRSGIYITSYIRTEFFELYRLKEGCWPALTLKAYLQERRPIAESYAKYIKRIPK
jgi:hypothetical protein